jgi:hypothetical protein
MLPALLTPVDHSLPARMKLSGWRRTTFICSACMMLLASCSGIPDQDACIDIDAGQNDKRVLTVDTTRVYDTLLSSLQCTIKYKNGHPATAWPVSFFIDSAEVKKITGPVGSTALVWVKEGTYSLGIGDPSEYPCVMIHNLKIPGGRGIEINITLPTNE